MRGPTGYLGYSYMETPGNPVDGIDNDEDGIRMSEEIADPGIEIIGQEAIRNYVNANYDLLNSRFSTDLLNKDPHI
jgi:hypothetical protein